MPLISMYVFQWCFVAEYSFVLSKVATSPNPNPNHRTSGPETALVGYVLLQHESKVVVLVRVRLSIGLDGLTALSHLEDIRVKCSWTANLGKVSKVQIALPARTFKFTCLILTQY